MPRVLVESPYEPTRAFDVRDDLTVGSDPTADITLADPEAAPLHLRFRLSFDQACSALDLGSAHGTRANGDRIKSIHRLTDGDVLEIGRTRIRFVDPEEASFVVALKDVAALAERSEAARAGANDEGRRLRVFYDLARALRHPEDIDALLGQMLSAILDVFSCDRGVIGLHDLKSPAQLERRIVRVRGEREPGPVIISQTLIDATLVRRKAIIATDAARGRSIVFQNVLAAMGAPLLRGDKPIGYIYVDDRGSSTRFGEKELEFLGALAHFTSAALENAYGYRRAVAAVELLHADSPLRELIGDSPPMRQLKREIAKYASWPVAHVFIRGESGTGKELVARTLHRLSPRAETPIVTLNCAAMPETMVESELFGHVKGAFTGAISDRRGKFVMAHQGTLFLDEIGDLSLSAQAKVLRAAQEGEVQPLGSDRSFRVDVRILSATHKDLAAEVAAGRFREDLYYRLNVLDLSVPPLRERPDDIPLLANRFLAAAASRGGKRLAGFTPRALEALVRYRFPGNVRELQNEVERAAIVVDGGEEGREPAVIDLCDLSSRIRGGSAQPGAAPGPSAAPRSLAERYAERELNEKAFIEEALAQAKGNVTEAARLLGVSRAIMQVRIKRFGLDQGDAGA